MALLIIFLMAAVPCFIVHSVIVATLVENGRTGWSFVARYAVWGIGFPFGCAAGLLLLVGLAHAGPGWLLGVFVMMVFAIGSLACIVSWAVVFLAHGIGPLMKRRAEIAKVQGAA